MNISTLFLVFSLGLIAGIVYARRRGLPVNWYVFVILELLAIAGFFYFR